jgi:hypothetical protein
VARSEFDAEFLMIKNKGKGKINFPNGDVYEGELKDGMMHGQGTLQNNQLTSRYEGLFRNGMKHGHGVLATNDSYYQGEWNYNKMQGAGIYTDRVGRFEGKYDAGLKDGEGTLHYNDGGVFRG